MPPPAPAPSECDAQRTAAMLADQALIDRFLGLSH
jgi:hypothetical protein